VVKASWKAILLPTACLVLGTGTLALAGPEIAERQELHENARSEADAFTSLRASLKLQETIAGVYIGTWHETLGNARSPQANSAVLAPAVDAFAGSLKLAERASVAGSLARAATLSASIVKAIDNKTRLGLIERLADEAHRMGASLGDGGGPTAAMAVKLLEVPSRIVGLDNGVTIDRMAGGIDPMTDRPDLREFVAGVRAGRGEPNPEVTTLSDVLGDGFTGPNSFTRRLERSERQPFARTFAGEVSWMLRGGEPVGTHPDFGRYASSVYATLDHVTDAANDDLLRQRNEFFAKSRAAAADRRWHQLLAAGALTLAVVAVFTLMSRVRRMLRTLRQASESDPVTQLLNRTGLRSRVAPWFGARGDGELAVAVIDIDHFKSVNDAFGHTVGDAILRSVANRVTNEVVASSTAVARWGGDEFVLVFRLQRHDTLAAITSVCRRIRSALNLPLDIGETPIAVTASVGAAVCTCRHCDVDDLFRVADHLLLAIKRETRDAVSVEPCGREPLSTITANDGLRRRSGFDRRASARRTSSEDADQRR
jgi:diguanylate cyclase (GGDEF)-like protein